MNILKIPDSSLPVDLIENEWAELASDFPYKTLRPHQKEAMAIIHWAFKQGFKNVVFEAPVGSGKSVSAMVMGFVRGPFYALTPSLGLQKQYISEFGAASNSPDADNVNKLKEVKGRSNFICPVTNETSDTAPCSRNSDYKCEIVKPEDGSKDPVYDKCPYKKQRQEAELWQGGVVSNPAYMFRACQSRYIEFGRGPRELLIFDEAHNAEEMIISFYERSLTTKDYALLGDRTLPRIAGENQQQWYDELKILKVRIEDIIKAKKKRPLRAVDVFMKISGHTSPPLENQTDETERLLTLLEKVEMIQKLFVPITDKNSAHCLLDPTNPVSIVREDGERGSSVKFRPVRANRLAPEFWDKLGKRRLFVSATLRPFERFCDDIGLKPEETFVVSVTESPFPLENRLIHCLKIGSMSHCRSEKTLPKQLDAIRSIVDAHAGQRGVILPFTHKIREATVASLLQHCPSRVMTHDSSNQRIPCPKCGTRTNEEDDRNGIAVCPRCGDEFYARRRDYIIKKFEEETDGDQVLVSTYVGEGFDLGGKKNVKFLVIQKVPYPDMGAREIKNRILLEQELHMAASPCAFEGDEGDICQNWKCRDCMTWYNMQAVRKIQQMCGRIVRTAEDHGTIYILDTSFGALFRRCKDMFAEYFQEAVEIVAIKK